MTTQTPQEVTATDFRQNVAKLFRDAEYGITTVITRDGKPVAQLGPIPTEETHDA